jgi:hypothetical protein
MSYSLLPLDIGPWQIAIIFVILGMFILPIIALIDILSSRFKENDKLIWVLVVVLFNIIGSILYFILGRKQKIKN